MDFLSYRETGHIRGPSGKGHIRALDIGGIRRYREISHVCPRVIILSNYDGLKSPMLHAKFRGNRPTGSGEEDF